MIPIRPDKLSNKFRHYAAKNEFFSKLCLAATKNGSDQLPVAHFVESFANFYHKKCPTEIGLDNKAKNNLPLS
jgi:hypothetical protein